MTSSRQSLTYLELTLANPGVNPYDESVSTKTKGKEMELLLITLAFSVVAIVAQLGDVASTQFGATGA
jgi:hypothetical protein